MNFIVFWVMGIHPVNFLEIFPILGVERSVALILSILQEASAWESKAIPIHQNAAVLGWIDQKGGNIEE